MSITAMNWAWRQQVAPTVKLVLMSLADAADDHGVCWPSIPTVARKCCVTTRTVQRIMRGLAASGRLRHEPRFRNDGSNSSNRYTLALDGEWLVSVPPDTGVSNHGPKRREGGDTGVTPGTASKSKREPPRPPLKTSMPTAPAAAALANVGNGDDGSGDHHDRQLEYPKGLSEIERAEARKKLADLPANLAQQLLDELAGRMKAGSIRITPLAYLRGLVTRAGTGDFTPDVALQIADRRKRRRQNEAALRQAEAAHREVLKNNGHDTAMHASDSPLVRRLAAIRNRSRCRSGSGE